MGLSTHELFLILRARDEASRVLRGFGGTLKSLDAKSAASAQRMMSTGAALVGVGVGLAAGGVLALNTLNRMTDSAIAYNEQVATTLTQVDKARVGFRELWKMGLNIATTIPVAFDDIQTSLYDIFSSIDTNGPGAAKILETIARAAVGGKTGMQTAGKAIIGILNAYKMGAAGATHVSDVMFQLVRKGVGTYEQFTATIGRAVPSAIKAGQSIESLSGMLAFLTRNGLSTAMAAASAARALDALSNPATVKHFKALGVAIYDTAGRMRPVATIMADLRTKMAGMSQEAKASKLKELFKNSGGTIQAMRFFNHAVNDTVNVFADVAKANFAKKFAGIGIAFKDAEGYIRPMPELVRALTDKFKNLGPAARDAAIAKFFAGSSSHITTMAQLNKALSTHGSLLSEMSTDMHNAGGAAKQAYDTMANTPAAKILLLNNRYKAMKITIGEQLIPVKLRLVEILSRMLTWWNNLSPATQKFIVKIIAVSAALAVLIGVIVAIVGVITMFAGAVALAGGAGALAGIIGIIGLVVAALAALGVGVYLVIQHWDALRAKAIEIWNNVIAAITPVVNYVRNDLVRGFQSAVAFIVAEWNKFYAAIQGPVQQVITSVRNMVSQIWSHIQTFMQNFQGAGEAWKHVWNVMVMIVRDVVWPAIQSLIQLISIALSTAFAILAPVVSAAFTTIGAIISRVVDIVGAMIRTIILLINGDYRKAWNAFVDILKGMVNLAIAIVFGFVRNFVAWIRGLVNGVINLFRGLANALVGHSIIPDMINAIIFWFASLPGRILGIIIGLIGRTVGLFASIPGRVFAALASLGSALWTAITNAFNRMMPAIAGGIGSVLSFFTSLPSRIVGAIGNLGGIMVSVGEGMIQGLINGMGNMLGAAANAAASVASAAVNAAKHALHIGSPSRVFHVIGTQIVRGLANGITYAQALAVVAARRLAQRVAAAAARQRQYATAVRTLRGQGKAFVDAISAGIKSGNISSATIGAKVQTMLNQLYKAQLKGVHGVGGVAKVIRADNNLLTLLSIKRTSITNRLAAATVALDDISKKYSDVKTSITDVITGGFDITKVGDIGTAIYVLQQRLDAARQFVTGLNALSKKGIDKAQLAKLAAAGPEAAGNTVQALLQASQADIKTFNSLLGQLQTVAEAGGASVAESLYGAGVRAARGLVDGLKSQQAAIQKQMNTIALAMVNTIKKALGIKSPSQVFHGLGRMISMGLIHGIRSNMDAVSRAGKDLANASVYKPSIPAYSSMAGVGAFSSAPGNDLGKRNIDQHFTIYTQEIDPRKHAADLGWELGTRVS